MKRVFASAVEHHRSGRARQAERACARILDRHPGHAGAWHLLGLMAAESGKMAVGAGLIAKAIELGGPEATWCLHLGMILEHEQNFPGALACYRQALEASPEDFATAFRMGTLLVRCGEYEEAIERFRQAVRTKPDFVDAWFNLGVVSSMTSRVSEAISAYRRAIELNPQAAKAHNNLAILFQANGRLEEAAAGYETALRHEPDYVEARYNLGLLCQQQDRLTDAMESYQRVLKTAPKHVEAFNNLGNTLLALNRPMEAREAYCNALAVDAANTESIWNLGFVDLLLGNFEEGWRNYEWRFKQSQKTRRFSEHPRWQGEPLQGKRLLLWAEQGLGDTIQMIRFAGSIKDAGGRVILECPKALAGLLKSVPGIDEIVVRGEEVPAFDVHLPLMSLPGILRVNSQVLPGPIPYLAGEPEKADLWRSRLESYARPRVGLVWSGNPKHANDRNRSMDPALLRPLLAERGSFHTLQPDATAIDGMVSLGGMLTDFAETAAAISAMDLVISVDTSVAHLAGALGRPVWTLLPHAPDWRWMLDRTDSPWYPSMRLFRQATRGDWAGVVSRVIEELRSASVMY